MKFSLRLLIIAALAGFALLISVSCDSRNVFDKSYELSPKAYQNIEDIYLTIDAENDEKLIRESFVAEANAALSGVSDCSKIRAAVNGFDQYQAANILRHSLPTDNIELRKGNTKKLLKTLTGLVATKYFLDTKVVFDSKMLTLLDEGFNYRRKTNVFRQAGFVKTAKKIIYWHWKNYRASDKVFYSTNKDYFPFSENELSLVFWSEILFRWSKNKYKKDIMTELERMNIVEKIDGKFCATEAWKFKVKKDLADGYTSKICEKLDLSLRPDFCTDYIIDRLNGKEIEELGGSCGIGGGYGGGYIYRRSRGHGDCFRRKPKEIAQDIIHNFEKENLLPIGEIEKLISSDETEEKFRGTIHLFRLIRQQKDCSYIDDLKPAFSAYNPQLMNYIEKKLKYLLTKTRNSKSNSKYLKKFLYTLFSEQNSYRFQFLKLIFITKDDKFIDSFIELMLNGKITIQKNQVILIDYIVETKRTKFVPRLFNWRFKEGIKSSYAHYSNNGSENYDIRYISVSDFYTSMLKLSRHDTLINSIRILKKLDTDKCKDIRELAESFFSEITGTKCDYYNYDDKYDVDSEILDSNIEYLHDVYLFKDERIRRQFYMAVSQNCSINVDGVICNWFEQEQDEYLREKIIYGFAENIFKFKQVDDEKADIKQIKLEIRSNEIRFKRLADIAINDESSSIRGYVFRIAPYFRAETGWQLIRHFFDKNKQKSSISYYLNDIDQLEQDKLQLIEVGKLTRYLYKYLIEGLAFEKTTVTEFFITALEILSK